jgi:hypothetical protein
VQTYYDWQKAHPEFLESIMREKILADAEVADKLYQRALGYVVNGTKLYRQGDGSVLQVPYQIEHPPDMAAASLWLRNRQQARGRRGRRRRELDGPRVRGAVDRAADAAARGGATKGELISALVRGSWMPMVDGFFVAATAALKVIFRARRELLPSGRWLGDQGSRTWWSTCRTPRQPACGCATGSPRLWRGGHEVGVADTGRGLYPCLSGRHHRGAQALGRPGWKKQRIVPPYSHT